MSPKLLKVLVACRSTRQLRRMASFSKLLRSFLEVQPEVTVKMRQVLLPLETDLTVGKHPPSLVADICTSER